MSLDAKVYDSVNKPHLNYAQKLIELINKYDKKSKFQVIIDVGCGSGNITKWMAAQFEHGQVFGIDISPEMIGFAEQNAKTETIEYVLTDLSGDWHSVAQPIERLESKVSMVFSNFCIMYIKQKLTFVQNLRRLMAPGSCAFFSYFAFPDPTYKLTNDLNIKFGEIIKIPTDGQQMQTWTQLFEANGFTVEYQEIDRSPLHIKADAFLAFKPFFSIFLDMFLKKGFRWEELSDEIRDNLITLLVDITINSNQSSVDWKIMDRLNNGTFAESVVVNQSRTYLVCKAIE